MAVWRENRSRYVCRIIGDELVFENEISDIAFDAIFDSTVFLKTVVILYLSVFNFFVLKIKE